MEKGKFDRIVDLIFEARILKYIKRAGLQYLKGPVLENLAEHHYYVCFIGLLLAQVEQCDVDRVLKMCLIHDLVETRVGERNLINKFYTSCADEASVLKETLGFSEVQELVELCREFRGGKTKDALVTRDADTLAQMLLEKECLELGNKNAQKWLEVSYKRLKSESAKKLGEKMMEKGMDEWWMELSRKKIDKVKFL